MVGTERVDEDLLIDLLRRSPMLEALRETDLDRGELQERLGVSRATCHRHTRLLGDLGVVERVDGRFGLTESGRLLTEALVGFKHETRSALRLAPVLAAVRDAPVEIDPDAFLGATVTSATRGDPYSPVARFVSLGRASETLRGFDVDTIAPLYIDEIMRRILDGMETEIISLPEVTEDALDGYPEKCMEACASGNLTVQLHEELPFGLVLFDERVGIGVSDRDSRSLRVFADTDATAVRAWAEAVYERYEAEAVVMEEYTREGFRRAASALASPG